MRKHIGIKPGFATAINCMDGRIQAPVMNFIKDSYGVDYVDMITVPGPDRVLSKGEDTHEIESIKKKVSVSFEKHNSKLIFIIGHYDCAGNPCAEKKHLEQIKKAVQNVKKWKIDLETYGLWVDKELRVFLIR